MCGLRTGKHSEKSRQASNEKTNTEKKLEKYVGDGLTLKMESNETDIEITGDGCRLTLTTNSGRIRINGDGCRLRIERNAGAIEYRGDGGRVSLGAESTDKKVQYFGEGGRVNVARNASAGCGKNFSTSGAAATKKHDPRDIDDCVKCTDIVDNIIVDKKPRRILRTTSKTVRIVYGNPNNASPTRKRNTVEVSKTCTVAN